MKKIIFIITTITSLNTLGAPCNGAPGKFHLNPDGSNGGFIERTAMVAKEAFIDSSSEICGRTILKGPVQVESGSRIEENVSIEGGALIRDSHIFGYAKIKGRAVVQGSEVCQASLIEGIKVINSKYYCQTEDPQPRDPGEAGERTLLGMDIDGDGVRDDIEIFINKYYSNTAKKNFSIERSVTKSLARILQKEILLKKNPNQLAQLNKIKINIYDCFDLAISSDLLIEVYNTDERLFSSFDIAGALHGKKDETPPIFCSKSIDYYNELISHIK